MTEMNVQTAILLWTDAVEKRAGAPWLARAELRAGWRGNRPKTDVDLDPPRLLLD